MKKIILVGILLLTILLIGCGVDSKYEKLMKQGDNAIDEWDFKKAIETYEEALTLDLSSIKDGDIKQDNIESSIKQAKNLLSNKDIVKKEYNEIVSSMKNKKINIKDISKSRELYERLLLLQMEFGMFPNSNISKEIESTCKKLEDEVKNNSNKLISGIETDLKNNSIDKAVIKVQNLRRIYDKFPELLDVDMVHYEDIISNAEKQYIEFPRDIISRNSILYEGKLGKVSLIGEGERNNSLCAFYKYEGDLKDIARKINLKTNIKLSDGKYLQGRPEEYRYYKDYTIGIQHLSNDVNLLMKEISYENPFDSTKTDKYEYSKSQTQKIQLNSVKRYPNKEFNTKIILEDDLKKIEITKIRLNQESTYSQKTNVEFEGEITFKKDMTGWDYESKCYLIDPKQGNMGVDSFTSYTTKDFAKNFAQNFKLNFMLPSIQKDTKYLALYFMDIRINIDLKTGKKYMLDNENLDELRIDNGDWTKLNINIDETENTLFVNENGKSVVNTVEFDGGSGFFVSNEPNIKINTGGAYTKLKVDICLDKRTSSQQYKNAHLEFIADGKVVKTTTFSADSTIIKEEIPLNKCKTLIIKSKIQDGAKILLQNGKFYK